MTPTGQQTADQIVEREVRELVRQRALDPGNGDAAAVRRLIDEVVADYTERRLVASMPPLTDPGQVAKAVADRVVGMGPLQPFFDDPDVEEIWINEPGKVFVAKTGRPQLTTTVLDEQQVCDLVELMLRASGRRVDLPDITRRHWAVNIRRFVLRAHSLAELVRLGTMTGQCARFLEAAVVAGLNIVTAGATQAGKTTLLNCLAAAIPPRERVITCEGAVVHYPLQLDGVDGRP
jgi:pilus assembly protein CpaF